MPCSDLRFPSEVWAAEDLEVRPERLSLLEGVGQVLPQRLRQEERDGPSDDGKRPHYHQRQHVAVFTLEFGIENVDYFIHAMPKDCLQGLAKRWAPGCVSSAGKARQKR